MMTLNNQAIVSSNLETENIENAKGILVGLVSILPALALGAFVAHSVGITAAAFPNDQIEAAQIGLVESLLGVAAVYAAYHTKSTKIIAATASVVGVVLGTFISLTL